MTDQASNGRTRTGGSWGRVAALTAGGAALVVLHQDSWNWKAVHPFVLGFLPVGLAYHAAFSAACAVYMGLLVRYAWPRHLENVGDDPGGTITGLDHK